MAKTIYICTRNKFSPDTKEKLFGICKSLEPDNIDPPDPAVAIHDDIAYGIMNPNRTLRIEGSNVLMGDLFGEFPNWQMPLSEFPDGSYALFRTNDQVCEIVADVVASRTIWYYQDQEVFVASTSQRAIVMYLENFEFNEKVIPWMLSTGSLGPDFSWDKRLKRVLSDSSVVLDKKNWKISVENKAAGFKAIKRPAMGHREILDSAIKSTFKSLNIDVGNWVLPLSGGYDSRAILLYLLETNEKAKNIDTITWGLESSQNIKGNDAKVAKDLALKLKVNNKYYHTDLSDEPIEIIVNRFISLGEGRIDHLAGYMDGFHIWKTLFEDGIQGIIRGDEGFGWTQVSSPYTVRLYTALCGCSDFSNLKDYMENDLPEQQVPNYLKRQEDESLETWRDRIYHEYRIPTILAGLSDLKLSYVEQINPLLSRVILERVRELPDNLRTEKSLFKKLVISMPPKLDFAISGANASPRNILNKLDFVNLLRKELSTDHAKNLIPNNLLEAILDGLMVQDDSKKSSSRSSFIRSYLKRMVPAFIKNSIRSNISSSLNYNILAFRVFIILRMHQMLNSKL